MQHVTSKDGTCIAYEQSGQGPALVIVGGVLGDHMQQAGLAALLAKHFTVYNIDRRGHGESGLTEPYAVEREVEDLDALIDAAGGSAFVYGTSGPGVLCLEAAARGLSPKIKKLAVWEPPYILEGSRPPVPRDYQEQLEQMLREGRRGDMVELFFTKAVGMPVEFVAPMRQAPFWAAQEAVAPTLINNAILMGDFSLPKERIAKVTVETLVIDGGTMPWISQAAQAIAEILPHAHRHTIAGQPHNVADEAMAPVLVKFFTAPEEQTPMIVRIWRGVTEASKAEAYLAYIMETGVSDYRAVPGNQGVQILHRTFEDRTEFLILSYWESFEAIRAFAGDDPERAVYYAKDHEYLLEMDLRVTHYEVATEQ